MSPHKFWDPLVQQLDLKLGHPLESPRQLKKSDSWVWVLILGYSWSGVWSGPQVIHVQPGLRNTALRDAMRKKKLCDFRGHYVNYFYVPWQHASFFDKWIHNSYFHWISNILKATVLKKTKTKSLNSLASCTVAFIQSAFCWKKMNSASPRHIEWRDCRSQTRIFCQSSLTAYTLPCPLYELAPGKSFSALPNLPQGCLPI